MSVEETYNAPNSSCCGRPMEYAKEPQCNYTDACMDEYCCPKLGSIKETEPDCRHKAVIPSITVESVEGITNLANCLVHVNDINTTFYVDDKHRVMITWAGPVDIPGYDMENNPEGFRDQIVTDKEKNIAVIYDKYGKGYTFGIEQGYDITEIINNKLDEMAASGELEQIIDIYLNAGTIHGFDTVADMKTSTVLGDGSYARTLGYHARNDQGSALYRIRLKTGGDNVDEMFLVAMTSDNTLVAELITETTISPEQIGCVNDGTDDDAVYIQKCIDFSKTNGVKVNFGHDVYYVKTGINLPQEYDIDFQRITLRAIANPSSTEGMVNIKSTWNIHNGALSNLKLDQNNLALKGIYLNRSWRRTYENIDIKNTPAGGYGIYLDGTNGGSGGNQFNNITGSGNYRYSTFIYVGVNDCVFSHVDYQQYTTGIEVSGFARLFDVHGYVATDTEFPDDWYTDSIFIKITSGRIMADELYPDTQNYCFYNYSVIPSQIGKIFFTFNENTSQHAIPSVMFKANDDNVELYYRWRVESLMMAISQNVLFELIKNSPTSTLSSYLHLGSITGAAAYPIDKPPVYAERIIPMNNFTKLGIYDGTLIATGSCQYATTSSTRDVCRTDVHSGYKLLDGYYSFKGINPDTNDVFDGTFKVENNTVTIQPNANQKANFQFFIQAPAQEANVGTSS